jgi:hypothetical protein
MASADDIVRLVARSSDRASLLRVLNELEIDIGCTPVRRSPDGVFEIHGFATRARAEALVARLATRTGASGEAEIVENVSATFDERRARVGDGSRFAARSSVPEGLGVKE